MAVAVAGQAAEHRLELERVREELQTVKKTLSARDAEIVQLKTNHRKLLDALRKKDKDLQSVFAVLRAPHEAELTKKRKTELIERLLMETQQRVLNAETVADERRRELERLRYNSKFLRYQELEVEIEECHAEIQRLREKLSQSVVVGNLKISRPKATTKTEAEIRLNGGREELPQETARPQVTAPLIPHTVQDVKPILSKTSTKRQSFVEKTRKRAVEAEYLKQMRLAQLEAECELEENLPIRATREARMQAELRRKRREEESKSKAVEDAMTRRASRTPAGQQSEAWTTEEASAHSNEKQVEQQPVEHEVDGKDELATTEVLDPDGGSVIGISLSTAAAEENAVEAPMSGPQQAVGPEVQSSTEGNGDYDEETEEREGSSKEGDREAQKLREESEEVVKPMKQSPENYDDDDIDEDAVEGETRSEEQHAEAQKSRGIGREVELEEDEEVIPDEYEENKQSEEAEENGEDVAMRGAVVPGAFEAIADRVEESQHDNGRYEPGFAVPLVEVSDVPESINVVASDTIVEVPQQGFTIDPTPVSYENDLYEDDTPDSARTTSEIDGAERGESPEQGFVVALSPEAIETQVKTPPDTKSQAEDAAKASHDQVQVEEKPLELPVEVPSALVDSREEESGGEYGIAAHIQPLRAPDIMEATEKAPQREHEASHTDVAIDGMGGVVEITQSAPSGSGNSAMSGLSEQPNYTKEKVTDPASSSLETSESPVEIEEKTSPQPPKFAPEPATISIEVSAIEDNEFDRGMTSADGTAEEKVAECQPVETEEPAPTASEGQNYDGVSTGTVDHDEPDPPHGKADANEETKYGLTAEELARAKDAAARKIQRFWRLMERKFGTVQGDSTPTESAEATPTPRSDAGEYAGPEASSTPVSETPRSIESAEETEDGW